jgi:hypothetical protein
MALPFGSSPSSRLPFAPPSALDPSSATNFVRVGGRADWVADQLAAEQHIDAQALNQHQAALAEKHRQERAQERQRREDQAAADKREKEAAAAAQKQKELDVVRAELRRSSLPSKLTDTDRARAERTLRQKEASLRAAAAAELRSAAETDPQRGETEGGFLGIGAQPTARAKDLQDRVDRLSDPAALTDDDLEAYRKLKPAAFDEVESLRSSLTKDDEARQQRAGFDQSLARAKAVAGGLSAEEADAIVAPPPNDPVQAHLDALAAKGKLEREGADLEAKAASLQRQQADAQQISTRLADLETALRKGGTAAQLSPLLAQRESLLADHAALAASLQTDTDAYNASLRAFEAKRQAFNERQPVAASTPTGSGTPSAITHPPSTPEAARQHARRLEDGSYETNDTANLHALTSAHEKVFWAEADAAAPVSADSRAAATQATNESLATVRDAVARTSAGLNEAVERVEQRVLAGDLTPQAALRERETAITQAEAKSEAESALVSQHLSDALENFAAGKIDAQTLNAVFHAAGHPQTGVERFAEVQSALQADRDHVAALEKVILGSDAGNSDPSLNGTELSLLAEVAKWQDIATRNATGDLSSVSNDEFGFGTTHQDLLRAADHAQKKADRAKAELLALRQTHRTRLAAELTRRGVDLGDHDRLITQAELSATQKASPGIAAVIASRGGLVTATGEKLPFVGGLVQAARILPYASTALKLQHGEPVPPEELEALSAFVRFAGVKPGFWTKAVDGITELPGFATELYATGGIATAVKEGGLKVLKEALIRAATKEGRQQLAEVMARSSARNVSGAWAKHHTAKNAAFRLSSGLVQEAVRLPVASAGRMIGKFAEDTALQGLTLSPQEGRLVAVVDSQARKGTFHRAADAVVDSYIENLSERSGPWLTAGLGKVTPAALRDAVGKLGNAAKGRLLSAALVKSLVAKNPRVPLSKIHTFLKGAHIGGTFEEMGEERVGSLARDLWRGISSDQWGLTLPSGEDLAVEFLTFLVPGAANAISTHRHFSRLDYALRASDTESHAHLEGLGADPAAHAQRLSTLTGQPISPADLAAARDLTGPVHAADAVRRLDKTQLDLMERAEAALMAGDLEKASRLKQMALAHSRLRSDAADAATLQGIQAVREIGHLRTQASALRDSAAQLAAADPASADLQASQAETLEQAAHRASALVKIARGREAMLTVQEQAALQTAAQPAVAQHAGSLVITDSAREELAVIAPTAARYIKQSESLRLEQINATSRTTSAPSSAASSSSASPATGSPSGVGLWTGKGTKGTRLSIPAASARSPQEAMEQMANQLPNGEDIDGSSIMPPPRSTTAGTSPAASSPSSIGHPPSSASPLAIWRATADSDVRASLPRQSHDHARRVLDELQRQLLHNQPLPLLGAQILLHDAPRPRHHLPFHLGNKPRPTLAGLERPHGLSQVERDRLPKAARRVRWGANQHSPAPDPPDSALRLSCGQRHRRGGGRGLRGLRSACAGTGVSTCRFRARGRHRHEFRRRWQHDDAVDIPHPERLQPLPIQRRQAQLRQGPHRQRNLRTASVPRAAARSERGATNDPCTATADPFALLSLSPAFPAAGGPGTEARSPGPSRFPDCHWPAAPVWRRWW